LRRRRLASAGERPGRSAVVWRWFADSREERQPVAGEQGAVGGAGTGVGDGGKHGEPSGGTDLLCGDEQAACDALLAGRAPSRPSGSRLFAFAAGQYP
jgi:hypothetical protein